MKSLSTEKEIVIEKKSNHKRLKLTLDKSAPFKLSNFNIIEHNNSLTLVSNISSEVYRAIGDTLYHFGYNQQHYALQFSPYIYIDTVLYSFGGYGFWTTKNILRFWNDTNGWTPITFPESSLALKPAHSSTLHYSKPYLYVIGGRVQNNKNALIDEPQRFLQRINLKTKEIVLQEMPISFSNEDLLFKQGDSIVSISDNNYFLYNISQNEVFQLEPTEKYYLLKKHKSLFLNGNQFVTNDGDIHPFESLFFIRSSMKNQSNVAVPTIIGVIIILMFIFFTRRKRNDTSKSFFVTAESINFENTRLKLEPNEFKILRLYKNTNTRSVEEINAILPEVLSQSHRNKLRLTLIRSVNDKAKEVSGNSIDEILKREKNPNDSRMSIYVLTIDLEFSDDSKQELTDPVDHFEEK